MKSVKYITAILFFAITTLLLAACGGGGNDDARVATAEVGSVKDARFGGEGWSLDGTHMVTTREKLLARENFSLSGTVKTSIKITDTLLSNFDIFFIGYLDDFSANAFTPAELDAFSAWVTGGGILIVTCDDSNHKAVCEKFGYPPTDDAISPPTIPAEADVLHPIFDGPFGSVAEIGMSPNYGYFMQTDKATILGVDKNPQPSHATILEKQVGTGRVIFLSDVDMITDYPEGREKSLSTGTGIITDNDRFLGNLFAYVTGLI